MTYKPDGYTDVSPYLVVDGVPRTIEFLVAAFDAEPLRSFEHDEGGVMHAEVRVGDSVVMMGDASPPDWPAAPAHVHLYVPDVDAAYRRALAAGAESVQEPVQRDDPDKRGGVRDPGGITWWLSTMVGMPEDDGDPAAGEG